jgi:pimeloyl-ACP methyl ester carboxylesterase
MTPEAHPIRHRFEDFHGILTGQENWTDEHRRNNARYAPGLAVEEYSFAFTTGLGMYASGLLSPIGWLRQDAAARWHKRIAAKYPLDLPFSLVGHSYGTWLIQGMLWRHTEIRPRAVVLVGSVLSSHFASTRWGAILDRGQVDRLLVLWSPHDWIVDDLSQPIFGKKSFGHLGSRGFVDGIPPRLVTRIRQVQTEESHTSYWSENRAPLYFDIINQFCAS